MVKQYASIRVNKDYFDGWFEPERKKASKRLNKNLSQSAFTEYIRKSNAQLVFPKMDNRFAPKKRKGGSLGLF